MKPFASNPLELPKGRERISRADLVFYEVEHSGPSYVANVFLDNPEADLDTPLVLESGYVGAFTVFGHGGCFGGDGHCHPERPTTDEFDRRGQHPLQPFVRTVEVTDALKSFSKKNKVVVSVVPVVSEVEGVEDPNVPPAGFVRLAVYEG